jgi:two-component system chemotaxis response regulator CheB
MRYEIARPEVICIGASAGGVTAIQRLLSALYKPVAQPIVITQHIPPQAKLDLDLIFGSKFRGKLLEVRDKMPLEAGTAFFAPPDYHVLFNRDHYLSLSHDESVHYSRPSIDVMMESAAWAYGPQACGILLTGANADGADGLKAISLVGGVTLVQDPKEAESPSMPLAAIDKHPPDFVLKIDEIAAKIMSWTEAG